MIPVRNDRRNRMTNEEKAQVLEYRKSGLGYKKIAQLTGISANSIKSFCQRQAAGSPPTIKTRKPGEYCENCGKDIEQTVGRKKKRFCSDKCRMEWWNSHQEKIKRKAVYEFDCPCCGKHFIAYGNAHRKYCSHSCYVTDRFGRRV